MQAVVVANLRESYVALSQAEHDLLEAEAAGEHTWLLYLLRCWRSVHALASQVHCVPQDSAHGWQWCNQRIYTSNQQHLSPGRPGSLPASPCQQAAAHAEVRLCQSPLPQLLLKSGMPMTRSCHRGPGPVHA